MLSAEVANFGTTLGNITLVITRNEIYSQNDYTQLWPKNNRVNPKNS